MSLFLTDLPETFWWAYFCHITSPDTHFNFPHHIYSHRTQRYRYESFRICNSTTLCDYWEPHIFSVLTIPYFLPPKSHFHPFPQITPLLWLPERLFHRTISTRMSQVHIYLIPLAENPPFDTFSENLCFRVFAVISHSICIIITYL